MQALVLRLDAPLMSFGGVRVDHHGFTDRFPGLSMVAGLLANALGWRHRDMERIQRLQERLLVAARWDVPPVPLLDYQTVKLGQPKMMGYARHAARRDPKGGWTTRGEVEWRTGGSAKEGTHQRYRHHWADGIMTLLISLDGADRPGIDDLESALRRPARPLFLGRKACLPSRPLLDPEAPVIEAADLLAALEAVPLWRSRGRRRHDSGVEACWPAGIADDRARRIVTVHDTRDWHNQLHTGARRRAEGVLDGGLR